MTPEQMRKKEEHAARALKWATCAEFRRATWEAAKEEARERWKAFPARIAAGYGNEAHALAEKIRAAYPGGNPQPGSPEWEAISAAQACAAWLTPLGACGYQAAALELRAERITAHAVHEALFAALDALALAQSRVADLETELRICRTK